MVKDLLTDWCDGMLAVQIDDPGNLEVHGALGCPACNKIHGRCMDAVYPFLYMADKTGEKKYLEAGIKVMEWADNVTSDDGSWTVIPDPKSWKGITVFGAIALAEALHHHGHLLGEDKKHDWIERLKKAGDFIFKNFTMSYSNINYGFTAVYGLNLLGKVLNNPSYVDRSRELAKEVKKYFTEPNKLLFGEVKPIDRKSARGLNGVDLGYNVEESLNGVVLYALEENDEELLQLLTRSMESHMEFMLPDGAWDNSWGTRQNKWSYWGSRTTDGCQPAFSMMADRNPAFGTAAIRSTELLKRCTSDGLLHGGLHYVSHGVKPCVHHTFAHAKSLAFVLNAGKKVAKVNDRISLPRDQEYGVKEFPEIATWLLSKSLWRCTVTAYDCLYLKRPYVQQATGGLLAVLYHQKVGLLFAASMARYIMVEKNNQQPNPGEDFALTPRIESFNGDRWYTNLYDLKAQVKVEENDQRIQIDVQAALIDEDRLKVEGTASNFLISYTIHKDYIEFKAKPVNSETIVLPTALVLPVMSPTGEKVTQVSPTHIEIEKLEGNVVLKSNVALTIKAMEKERVFNMVPGVEAVPIFAEFNSEESDEISVKIQVLEV
jgi:hypothetical protein